MDLTSALTNFQTSRLFADLQVRVARKLLETQKLQGSAMVQLIEAAGKSPTKSGDALVAAATGLGGQVDTLA